MGQVSGAHWTALARLTREFHPLRVSQVALFACDGSRPMEAASTLGLRLGNRISPICGSSPPGPPRPVCARTAALPIPPFSKRGRGLLIPARLSSRTHIGRIQWTYSITGLSPARTNAPPDALVPTYNRFKTSLKLREVFIIASLFLCFFITELTLTQEPC